MYPILQPNRENVKQGTWTEMPKFFLFMKYNERTEAKLKFNGTKAELIRMIRNDKSVYYVIRINRKVDYKTNVYNLALKYFATVTTNIITQLKIY